MARANVLWLGAALGAAICLSGCDSQNKQEPQGEPGDAPRPTGDTTVSSVIPTLQVDAPHVPENGVYCTSCHSPSNFDDKGGSARCQECHQKRGITQHDVHRKKDGTVIAECAECHDPHYQDQKIINGTTPELSMLLRTSIRGRTTVFAALKGKGSFAEGSSPFQGVCETCHTKTQFHRNDTSGNHVHKAGSECIVCHPHENGFRPLGQTTFSPSAVSTEMGSTCTSCHDRVNDPPHVPANGVYCASCHDPAAGFATGGTKKCLTCHKSQGVATTANVHTKKDQVTVLVECIECHEPHFQQQKRTHGSPDGVSDLVRTSVRNHSVKLVAATGAGSLADGDATYDGACEVCHTQTKYHRNDATGNHAHKTGQKCTNCHKHENGFQPAGGNCVDCHAEAQGIRRPIVAEFPASGGHHGATPPANITDEECLVCHTQSAGGSDHMDGTIRLRDAKGGAPYLFANRDAGRLAKNAPGDSSYITSFCLGCHDATGATATHVAAGTALQPFATAGTPTDILQRLQGTYGKYQEFSDDWFGPQGTRRWTNPRHDVLGADQAKSGAKLECVDCHSSHGANPTNPIADPNDPGKPYQGTAGQFCLECHGNKFPSGVAGWDIAAVTTSRWGSTWQPRLRNIRDEDLVDPFWTEFAWNISEHGGRSYRSMWGGTDSPAIQCNVCHDSHGSWTPTNTLGNVAMIRDRLTVGPSSGFKDDGLNGAWTAAPHDPTPGDVVINEVQWSPGQWKATFLPLCVRCHAGNIGTDWSWGPSWLHDPGWVGDCRDCHTHGYQAGELGDWGTNFKAPSVVWARDASLIWDSVAAINTAAGTVDLTFTKPWVPVAADNSGLRSRSSGWNNVARVYPTEFEIRWSPYSMSDVAEFTSGTLVNGTILPAGVVNPRTLTGTIGTLGVSSTAVVGTGTAFLTEVAVGDVVGRTSFGYARVVAIASDTSLTLEKPLTVPNASTGYAQSTQTVTVTGLERGKRYRLTIRTHFPSYAKSGGGTQADWWTSLSNEVDVTLPP